MAEPLDPKYRYRNFLHPRFWPTWLGIGLLHVLSWLPHNAQQALGAWVGGLVYRLGGRRIHVTRRNIQVCFPALDPAAQEALIRDSLIANARGFLECTKGWWRDMTPYARKLEFHGLEHLHEAQARGKGILLLGGHFSLLDFGAPLIAQVLDFNYMYRPHNNPLFNAVIQRARGRRMGQGFTKRQLRAMVEFVREGNTVWYGFDQDFGTRNSVFAPFFGIPAATLTTPAWIARETGASVLMVSQFREGNGVYSIRFSPLLEDFPGADEVTNATRINALLEAAIRVHPDQYLWMHRRFKTRPPGQASVY